MITTVCTWLGVPAGVFPPLRSLSRFLIVMAMAAIGLNTQVGKLIKGGGTSLLIGLSCWIGITGMSLPDAEGTGAVVSGQDGRWLSVLTGM